MEGLLQDLRVDQVEDVLAGAQAGCLDHGRDPAAGGDDAACLVVVAAMEVGAGRRPAQVLLVEEGREGAAGAGAVAASGDLRPYRALAARLLALDSGSFAFRRTSRSNRRWSRRWACATRRSSRSSCRACLSCRRASGRAKYRLSVVCRTP